MRIAVPLLLGALSLACAKRPLPAPVPPEGAPPPVQPPEAAAPGQPGAGDAAAAIGATPYPDSPDEPRLTNLRQLTHGGENAEAYFSADGKQLIFQATRSGESACDQIYVMEVDGTNVRRVSRGGRTTCGYFFPTGDRILYSSTVHVGPECPPPPDYSEGYVWALYDYDIYTARPDGSELQRLTETPGYDAEATISPDGRKIVFTSMRDGDLDIYTMNVDGSEVRRLTTEIGYDGGAFFSADGSKIVYRAYHPDAAAEIARYWALLEERKIRPFRLDIWVMDADGSNKRRVTENAAANFAPFFHPSGERIIFSSNLHERESRNFDLYMVNLDGSGLERVTAHPDFDGFPMFSPDGRTLVFASNRGARQRGETNVFLADWVEGWVGSGGQ